MVLELKAEKDKKVRESAANCLSGLKGLLGEDYIHKFNSNAKSVIAIKKEQAQVTENKRSSITQGKPRKVDENPFHDTEKPQKNPLFPTPQKNRPSKNHDQAKNSQLGRPSEGQTLARPSTTEEKPSVSRKSIERKPIKKQRLNPAFKDSMTEGVNIYVTYQLPEQDGPEQDLAGPDQQREHDADDYEPADPNVDQTEDPTDGPRPQKQHKNNKSDKNSQHEEEHDEGSDGRKEEEYEPEVQLEGEEEHQRIRPESRHSRTPVTGTHRTELDSADIEYNPTSLRKFNIPPQQEVEYDDPATDEFIRNEERLTKENHALQQEYYHHQQVIDFQNKRIESLMMQINNLTTNLNIVLNKAASLEQNVFQLNYQSQQNLMAPGAGYGMPTAYGMPYPPQFQIPTFMVNPIGPSMTSSFHSPRSYGQPEGTNPMVSFAMPNQLRPQGSFVSLPNPKEEIEMVRKQIAMKSKEITEWQQKRKEEEKKMTEKFARINKVKRETYQPEVDANMKKKTTAKITGDNEIEYRQREEAPVRQLSKPTIPKFSKPPQHHSDRESHVAQVHPLRPQNFTEGNEISFSNQRLDSLPFSTLQNSEPGFSNNLPEPVAHDKEEILKVRGAKAMNQTLARILEESEYRRLLDFLADRNHLRDLGRIERPLLQALVQKVADLLSYKAETYVEECLPWIAALLAAGDLVDLAAGEDLLYVVKMVLGTDKRKKLYQNHVLVQLKEIQADLEDYISQLKHHAFDQMGYRNY